MRKRLLVSLLMLVPAVAGASKPGDKMLTGQVGYQWGGTQEIGSTPSYPVGGSLHTNANMNFGGALGISPRPFYRVEFAYSYQGTDLLIRQNGRPDQKLDDISTQYYMLHGVREMPPKGKATPFAFGGIGAAGFSSLGTSKWFFAFDFGAGTEVDLNEKAALRLQVRGMVPVQWFSTGVYFGSGGSGVSAGGGSSIIQGDVSAGLTFKLGK
jgi:opacity protein-like surface antigen